VATIAAFVKSKPGIDEIPTTYNYLRAAQGLFKQLQFSILVVLVALPDGKILTFMEKLKLAKARSESNTGLLNLTARDMT
jgi:hypothetical protein